MKVRDLTTWPGRGIAATLLGLAAAAILTATAPARQHSLPKLLGDGQHYLLTWQVKPAHISYTGDGTGIVGGFNGTGASKPGNIRWRSWTANRGVGGGVLWLNDCEPSCAEGTFDAVPVTVTAFAVIAGHFTKLRLIYTYLGKHYVDIRIAEKRGKYWIYDIAH
jgi:hypothetical protein